MAEVTGQSIPQALQILYAQITSPGKVTQGADGVVKLKNNKKKPKKPPRDNLDLMALQAVARLVALELGKTENEGDFSDFVYTLTQELILGIVNPEYFAKCKIIQAQTLQSIPTSTPDPNPPPYGYRTPLFLPTIPTYPAGTVTTQPAGYGGEKVTGYFEDKYLRWRKIQYKSLTATKPDALDRVVIKWNARIGIVAGSRGSRPMLSLNLKARLSLAGGPSIASTEPPIIDKTSLYWRFKIPPSTPPYYNSYQLRSICMAMSRIGLLEGAGAPVAYVLNASNRPMMGRGFNNNDNIDTTLTGDPQLWEIRICDRSKHEKWEAIPYQSPYGPRDIAYSPELNVYVAPCLGYMQRSTNLTNWITYGPGGSKQFWGAAWSPKLGLFVVVGNNTYTPYLYTSPTGVTWTARTVPHPVQLLSVAWSESLGIFVAVGWGGTHPHALWSEDGITWNGCTGLDQGLWYNVIWAEEAGKFVAVGENTLYGFAAYSADGKSWGQCFHTEYTGLHGVGWSPELGLFAATTNWWPNGHVATSTDGVNWTFGTMPIGNSWDSVTWCPPLHAFIASGGSSGSANMAISTDGISWTPWDTGYTNVWNQVRWFDEACQLVGVGPLSGAPTFIHLVKGP